MRAVRFREGLAWNTFSILIFGLALAWLGAGGWGGGERGFGGLLGLGSRV